MQYLNHPKPPVSNRFCPAPPASLTLCSVGSDNAHGADPVWRDLGHQRVEHLQAGGVHHKDFWVVAVAKQASLPLGADGELIELEHRGEREKKNQKGEERLE